MPFDAMTMAAVAAEIRSTMTGARIQKIVQPSVNSVALSLYNRGHDRWLLLSANPQAARAHLTATRFAKAFPAPSPFVMLLRKYMDGGRVLEVTAEHGERIMTITVGRATQTVDLITEVMGRHSNVILVSEDATVLGALRLVTARQSAVRPVLPHMRYATPPEQLRNPKFYVPGPRVDPYLQRGALTSALRGVSPSASARDALLGLLLGASPMLVDDLLEGAGAQAETHMSELDVEAVADRAVDRYSLYPSNEWQPCTFTSRRKRADFAAIVPAGARDVWNAPSMSEAVERSTVAEESADPLAPLRKEILGLVERRRKMTLGRMESLREGMAATADAESVMELGQLVLAYGYSAPPHSSELFIPDLDRTIPLDPRLSPSENAERYFRRYRKLRDAREKLPGLIGQTESDLQLVEDLAVFAGLADNESALQEIAGPLRGRDAVPAKGRKQKKAGPARFRRGGTVAIVGRSARENEEVTFKLAQRGDVWLHARERTGAHVVLTGGPHADTELEMAARLAAYFSEGRSDTAVDVDLTEVRNVRKIPGAAAGRVTYAHARTIRAKPDVTEWERVR